jgi:hypothetical protein
LRPKRQMTMPLKPFEDAELDIGDRLRFRAVDRGRIVAERIDPQGRRPD